MVVNGIVVVVKLTGVIIAIIVFKPIRQTVVIVICVNHVNYPIIIVVIAITS